jgi:hypothetical protein
MERKNYHKEKMKVVYFLYKKERTGTVTKVGGVKLHEGCPLVPSNICDDITSKLAAVGVNVKKLEIYVNEDLGNLHVGEKG